MDTNRRDFIKKSCALCASLVGIATIAPLLNACGSTVFLNSEIESNTIKVDLSKFAEGQKLVVLQNSKLEFEIAVVQLEKNHFQAFKMECTHRSNPLVVTQKGFFCNLHGSKFNLDGTVALPPASDNLKSYPIQQTESYLLINNIQS